MRSRCAAARGLAGLLAAALAAGGAAAGPRPEGVRAVDWGNLTYPSPMPGCPKCLGAGDLTLVNGRTAPDPIFTDLEARLVGVTYADATNGPAEEALVEVFWRFSPKGTTTRYYLFGLRDARPVVVWSGYRLSYEEETAGLVAASLGRRTLVVEDLDSAGRRWRLTFVGTPDGPLKLARKQRLKPPRGR